MQLEVTQPEEEMALERPYSSLPVSKWSLQGICRGTFAKGVQWQDKEEWLSTEIGQFYIGCCEEILYCESVKHWARLPKEVIDVQFLEVFKARLGKVWSYLFL